MPFGYPVFLELQGRRVVVIGDAAVRGRKVEGLLEAGADDVLVIAPGSLRVLARVRAERRTWRAEDLDGAFLVIAGSDDPIERDAIAREARSRGALVNVMDDVPNCDWAAPAVVRRGDLVLAISTGGRSPALARYLREALQDRFGEEWGRVLEILREVRGETLHALPDLAERSQRWHDALDLGEAEDLVRQGRYEELRQRLRARLLSQVRA